MKLYILAPTGSGEDNDDASLPSVNHQGEPVHSYKVTSATPRAFSSFEKVKEFAEKNSLRVDQGGLGVACLDGYGYFNIFVVLFQGKEETNSICW